MEQKEFLNSNRTVIMYFIKLVKRLTPGYIPTLILQSLVKTLKPLIFILGPKLIVDELMAQSRTEVLIAIIGFIAIVMLNVMFLRSIHSNGLISPNSLFFQKSAILGLNLVS